MTAQERTEAERRATERGAIGDTRSAREGETPAQREQREAGLVYDIWHLDSVGQASAYAGSVSMLPDAKAHVDQIPQQAEAKAASVWVASTDGKLHHYVAPDGLTLLLVEARSAGDAFQDRLYAARGERASPSGLTPAEIPNAAAPRPDAEALAKAQEDARAKAKEPKLGAKETESRQENVKRT